MPFTQLGVGFVSKIDAGLVIAAALALFAIQALLRPGLPTSADLTVHIYRTLEFERVWASGVVVPRWSPNLAYGYGYPLFVFAPPLPYMLGAALKLSGASIETTFKALIIFTLLLYAVGMYLLVRELFASVAAALVSATAYTLAPFTLREALLEGGNLPQLLAIGLFPWSLWALTVAVRRRSWLWVVLAGAFYAAVMLSHLFQAFVFTPVLGLFMLILLVLTGKTVFAAGKSGRIRFTTTLQALFVPILGLLLSAFFWLPAFVERHLTRAQADIYLEKSPFFVRYPHWTELVAWIQPFDTRAANPYTPLTLGVITVGLAGLGLVAGILRAGPAGAPSPKSERIRRLVLILLFTAIALAAGLLSLPISRRIWESLEILQVAEFPWRMLGLANLGLAVLAGAAVWLVPTRLRYAAAFICIAALLLAVGPYLYPVIPFTRHGDLTLADQINYERSSQSIGTTTLGEYLPQTVGVPPTTSPLVESYLSGNIPERLDRSSLPHAAVASLIEQSSVTHRYQLDSPVDFRLRLLHFFFPGWQARLDDRPVTLVTEAGTGLMLVDIPAGRHSLTVYFGQTPIRRFASILTGLTLLALAAAGLLLVKRRLQYGVNHRAAGSERRSPAPVETPLRLSSPPVLLLLALIVSGALLVKPLLRPVFTVESPRERVVSAQHEADVRFANGIQLAGYDLSQRVVEAGSYLQVTLFWQTDGAPHAVNLQPFVHLDRLDNFTTVADATNYTPGNVTTETNMPTFHWDNFRFVRDEHDLNIPAETPPLAYAVRVGLIDPDQNGELVPLAGGGGDTAWIDTINVSPQRPGPLGPEGELAQSLDVLFSNDTDTIRLTGFETIALRSDRLEFALAWESAETPAHNYTIFAQLLDPGQNLVASYDRPPLDGAYPTSTWLPDQPIHDPRYLPLAGVSPGQYTLITGLYDPTTGQRLTTSQGADFVELSTITIE